MNAINLRTEHMENPLGIDVGNPLLSWVCSGGVKQTAFQIIAKCNGEIIWNSGKVESSNQSVRYGGSPAKDRERIYWSVKLWDENDAGGEIESAWFEMGLDSWSAKWIDPELPHETDERQPASYLKKHFTVSETHNARLYIAVHGMYEAAINGKRVGDFVLAPGTDDYRVRNQYQTYDVSDLLTPSENEITITLGDGWYRGNNGVDGLYNYYGSDLALLCQLEVGGKAVLVSDESWQASQSGPVRLNDMEKGEAYDARMETISDWHGVTIKDYSFDTLCCSNSVPILEQERFPGKIITTPNGETVIDFGQNLAGYTELRLTAKVGQQITLWHGETLDENGNFTQSNYDPGERNKNGGIPQRIDYTCKDGLNVYKPHFTIFGFRYAKIETDCDLLDAEFTAIAVYSQMAQTARFTCGNQDVNRLFLNSLWSMRSNFCDIPTDCPTRERAGWTGDAGAFAPTAMFLSDCYPVLRKWLAECRLAQKEDGLVSNIAPPNYEDSFISKMLQGSSGWGDACILVPWALYEAYGDETILAENYEMMTGWLRFVENRAKKTRIQNQLNPYKKYLVDEGFHFGEWLEPDVSSMETMRKNATLGAPEVATAYYHKSASIVAKIAEILGKTEDASKFAEIAEGAKNAYRCTCTKKGKIESKRQAEYVRPIAFGLLDEKESQAAADTLAKMVAENNFHLNTGFLATPYLCRVLADYGHTETAYKLLLQDTCPSWLYPVKHGATTIWESWDGIREDGTVHDSLNHYSYGAISGFLVDTVCGIRYSGGKLVIAPKPDKSLGFAKGIWKSPVGTIESSWHYEGEQLTVEITIPANMTAEIHLPDGSILYSVSGTHSYSI